jgi:hypothetical protein
LVLVAALATSTGSSGPATSASAVPNPVPTAVSQPLIERSNSLTISGSALESLPDSGPDPAIGRSVPTVTGKNFVGRATTIEASGKPQVIAVIAHWAPHAQAMVSTIMGLRSGNRWPNNVQLATLVTGTDANLDNYPPSAWLKTENWNAAVLLDDARGQQSIGAGEQAYGVTGFPFLIWTDANGKIVLRTAGEIPSSTLQSMLAQLSAGMPVTNPAGG